VRGGHRTLVCSLVAWIRLLAILVMPRSCGKGGKVQRN
jgi:hypothetical protein